MPFLLEGDVCAHGIPFCRASWYVVHTQTLLLASPTAHAALHCHGDGNAPLSETADLDFTLFSPRLDATSDKVEVVDYAFLSSLPQPLRRAGQTAGERQARLQRWISECFVAHNTTHFPDVLRAASPSLFFEYDAVLKNIGDTNGDQQRRVEGVVLPAVDNSGCASVRLTIPLLLEYGEKAYQALNNVAVLYCKFAHLEWRQGFQVSAVAADLHLHLRVHPKNGRVLVVTEEVTVRVTDHSAGDATASLAPFLHSCVNLHGLPRLVLTPQGGGFIDVLPQLEEVLYRRLREPLHFMKLVLGLVADLGNPVDLSVCCKGLAAADAPPTPPARKTAVFCVVDSSTFISFVVGLHYHSGSELPSIEVTCTQFLDAQHESPLSRKVKYAQPGAVMRRDGDGFIDVEELRVAVVHGVLECMSSLLTAL